MTVAKIEHSHIEDQHEQVPMEADPSSVEKNIESATIDWTPDEEKEALRKLDWNLIPL
jgi:hypothetical protein